LKNEVKVAAAGCWLVSESLSVIPASVEMQDGDRPNYRAALLPAFLLDTAKFSTPRKAYLPGAYFAAGCRPPR
jgi:hypothetical protein